MLIDHRLNLRPCKRTAVAKMPRERLDLRKWSVWLAILPLCMGLVHGVHIVSNKAALTATAASASTEHSLAKRHLSVSDIMFSHHIDSKTVPEEGGTRGPATTGTSARFVATRSGTVSQSAASSRESEQIGTRVKEKTSSGAGAAADPWWLNPPPWWLPPPPEWGAAPVSMYSSFYNPGSVQNPRPDRVPSAFAPYPIMT